MNKLISIVVPAHNEAAGIKHFYKNLNESLPSKYNYEILFVDDGSTDKTIEEVKKIIDLNKNQEKDIKLLSFSKNFGKEAATTAGIINSTGDATLILDADGQHPVNLIKEFIDKWEKGSQVVVGIRESNSGEGLIKRYGSIFFYRIFNKITNEKIVPGSTDFRLIDSEVRQAFSRLDEHSRITRALIDWLGYDRSYIPFKANAREFGEASYNTKKLISLAMNSFVSLTTFPLLISGYIGLIITPLSLLLGLFILIEQYMLGDPMSLKFTGSASLGILVVFLVGLILICQGLTSLYISRVYKESKNRPLYLINFKNSKL